jgi:hypothetical protein
MTAHDDHSPSSRPPWHALLAPLPAGAAILGWEHLVLDLSAGSEGVRVILVVLDSAGQPISASDMVLYRSAGAEIRQESLGGRFEPDGTFRGTRWRTVGLEPPDGEESAWDSTPAEPSADDVSALRELVSELVRRQPPRQ